VEPDTDAVEEDVKEEDTTDTVKAATYFGPEYDTLVGIYRSTYNTDLAINRIALFIDKIDWWFEVLYYGLIGAMIGWAFVEILKLLKIW
jgi:hypothetical protein